MQFYTKLRHAKIIIFLPRSVYLQYLFPGYFPDSVYFMVAGTCIIFDDNNSWECFCTLFEFWGKRFLWHIALKKQSTASSNSTMAYIG